MTAITGIFSSRRIDERARDSLRSSAAVRRRPRAEAVEAQRVVYEQPLS